jgi:MGT family glycosyltransferase
MATYAFFNIPTYGHVNPTLAIVQELVRRGHNVSYYLTEEFRDVIQATGAVFQPYLSEQEAVLKMSSSAKGAEGPSRSAMMFIFKDKRSVPPQIIDRVRAEQPDVVVYDFMCPWARPVIDQIGVPAVITRATYASNEHYNFIDHLWTGLQTMPAGRGLRAKMEAVMAEEGTSPEDPNNFLFSLFAYAEEFNIMFLPRDFQPAGETFDDRFLFIGPSISVRHEASDFPFDRLSNDRPLLYISLGSIATNQPEFYKQCFAAFAEQPWQVVLSIGKQVDPITLGAIPENFLLSSYVPQLEILTRTHLFITHAGTNSIMESMYFGVPMVMIPQQPEQQAHAQRVVDLGLGVILNQEDVTPDTLREAVETVNHEAYRERAQCMQQSVRQSGGYQRAVDALIRFAGER